MVEKDVRGIDLLALCALVCFPGLLLGLLLGLDRIERRLVRPSSGTDPSPRGARATFLRWPAHRHASGAKQRLLNHERAA